jgi:hypothetical protein
MLFLSIEGCPFNTTQGIGAASMHFFSRWTDAVTKFRVKGEICWQELLF